MNSVSNACAVGHLLFPAIFPAHLFIATALDHTRLRPSSGENHRSFKTLDFEGDSIIVLEYVAYMSIYYVILSKGIHVYLA